jgi:hypothetical protein
MQQAAPMQKLPPLPEELDVKNGEAMQRSMRGRREEPECCCRRAGTLKDDQHCYICGQSGHRQFECPNQAQEVFKLPDAVQARVEQQYQRDIARMAAGPDGTPAPVGARTPLLPQPICRCALSLCCCIPDLTLQLPMHYV